MDERIDKDGWIIDDMVDLTKKAKIVKEGQEETESK